MGEWVDAAGDVSVEHSHIGTRSTPRLRRRTRGLPAEHVRAAVLSAGVVASSSLGAALEAGPRAAQPQAVQPGAAVAVRALLVVIAIVVL
jgi:hypothetical protein